MSAYQTMKSLLGQPSKIEREKDPVRRSAGRGMGQPAPTYREKRLEWRCGCSWEKTLPTSDETFTHCERHGQASKPSS